VVIRVQLLVEGKGEGEGEAKGGGEGEGSAMAGERFLGQVRLCSA
jgi:hypothetical protein